MNFSLTKFVPGQFELIRLALEQVLFYRHLPSVKDKQRSDCGYSTRVPAKYPANPHPSKRCITSHSSPASEMQAANGEQSVVRNKLIRAA